MFLFLKFLHIIGAVLLLGSVVTVDLVTLKLILSKKNPALQIFYTESKFIEAWLIGPGSALTTISGIIMAFLWYGWPFWLSWGIFVVAFTGVTGSVSIPRIKKQLSDLIGSGSTDRQLIRKLSVRFILLISIDLLLLFSAVGTMIYKPTL